MAGLTGRLLAAGAWTLVGQAATTVASLVATPFGIRALGVELYGVLSLISLVIGYALFADLGMGQASTKFASEQHARHRSDGEAQVIWTALAMVIAASTAIALILGLASPFLMRHLFSLPERLRGLATLALQVALLGFVARNVAGVLNTATLVRLRFRLDTAINTGPAVLQILLVPVVLWLGGGLLGAVLVMVGASITTAVLHGVSGLVLLPQLRRVQFRRDLLRPMLRFGSGMVAAGVVAMFLLNMERLLLVRLGSVDLLGYYAVAANLGNIVGMLPAGIMNSLLPVFSRLRETSQHEQLEALYWRVHRIVLLGMPPLLVGACAFARPFIGLWAGPEFGRASTGAFYLLALGQAINLVTRVSKEMLKAHGETTVFARFYLWQIVPYAVVGVVAIRWWGVTGAALAYLLRVLADAVLNIRAATLASGIAFSPLAGRRLRYAGVLALIVAPLALLWGARDWRHEIALGISLVICLAAYCVLTWRSIMTESEREWIRRSRDGRRSPWPGPPVSVEPPAAPRA